VSSLFLVRHGQASLHADDYDNLSELGVEQARRLGAAFAERGLSFDAVYVGPKRRHGQTLELLASAAKEGGLDLPEAVGHEALDEVDAHILGEEAMRRVTPSCPDLKEQLARGALDDAGKVAMRHYIGVFEALMKRWAKGEFSDEIGPFDDFNRRVIGGMQKIMRAQGRNKRVLVVTSGGPISLVTRLALGVSEETVIELLFALNTGSVTELRYTENRLSLVRFNDAGYLPAHMLTGI
jgi:broad specificity phosphatase PhoE